MDLPPPPTLWILDGYEKVVQENVSMLIGMRAFVILNYFECAQQWIVF